MEREGGAIGNTAEDLIGRCRSALHGAPRDEAGLRTLIADCATGLAELVAERQSLLERMRDQIEEIAALVAAQDAVWPEEVARLRTLSEDIRGRTNLFAER